MSKRKSSLSVEDEFNRLCKKIKRLEKKIRVQNNDSNIQASIAGPSRSDHNEELFVIPPDNTGSVAPATSPPPSPDRSEHDVAEHSYHEIHSEEPPAYERTTPPLQGQVSGDILYAEQNYIQENRIDPEPSSPPAPDTLLQVINNTSNTEVHNDAQPTDLEDDILEILGDDPTLTVKYGQDIRKELASRLQHIATEGLSREDRKVLTNKFPLPANCLLIGAPKINPEIKAALSENILKRDKGIETKQKEMATAISCLTDIISFHLNSKDKNNEILQKLMDIGRILCDIQHGDSVTRRNFILFAVKTDMQEHLKSTKVDTCLFGENLSDTLKSAKAVNKTGADLKVSETNKSLSRKPKPQASQPLNRRAAAPPLYRWPAGAAPAQRGRGSTTAPRTYYRAPQPPAPAYRTSSAQPRPAAPPPPPRRRY